MTKQELEKIAKQHGYAYGWVKYVMAARAKKQKQKMRPFYENVKPAK